jgi:hypothetical protein
MTWNLLTVSFGNNKYRRGQSFLNKLSKQLGVNHFAVDEESLFNSEIYKENEEWFSKIITMVTLLGNHTFSYRLWRSWKRVIRF